MLTLGELDRQQERRTAESRATHAGVALSRRAGHRGVGEAASSRGSRSTRDPAVPRRGRLYCDRGITTVLPPSARERRGGANRSSPSTMRLQHLHVKRRRDPGRDKDINMRIKARALGIAAEDYFNDKVLEDTELLYTGTRELPADFWDRHGKAIESWQHGGHTLLPALPDRWCRRCSSMNSSTARAGRGAAVRAGAGDIRQDRGAADAQGLRSSEEQRLGNHCAQPRAELRAQHSDEPRDRFRDAARAGGQWQRHC